MCRRSLVVWAILMLITGGIVFANDLDGYDFGDEAARYELEDYVVTIYDGSQLWSSHFVISRDDEVLFHEEDSRFWIGGVDRDWDFRYSDVGFGQDVTGNGIPNVVVTSYTGGAHCCFTLSIYELGEDASLFQRIDGAHTEPILVDLDGDGVYEVDLRDWTFGYWRTSFASSPAPRVILSLQNGRYEVDTKHMSEPVSEHLITIAKEIQSSPMWDSFDPDGDGLFNSPPSELWGVMLDLIYTGHADKAWDFAEVVWPDGVGGKEAFLKDFKRQLERSPFWETVGEQLKEQKERLE